MTLLDKAEEWIEAMCVKCPTLRDCIDDLEGAYAGRTGLFHYSFLLELCLRFFVDFTYLTRCRPCRITRALPYCPAELAREQFHVWDSRHDALLELLQEHDHSGLGEGGRGVGGRHLHYALTRLLRALRFGHETLSVVLGAHDDPLPRQFRAMVLVSMMLGILAVDLWMCVSFVYPFRSLLLCFFVCCLSRRPRRLQRAQRMLILEWRR